MKHLYRLFPEFKEIIDKKMSLDPDFRRLCEDYEISAETIEHLTNVVNIPKEPMVKQINDEKKLLNELKMEIESLLDK